MKKTRKSTDGTSFFGTTITTTVNELRNVGLFPKYKQNTGEDKTNFDWELETTDGTVFTIYDWKEYRPISPDEKIRFHIGAFSESDSRKALQELKELLNS